MLTVTSAIGLLLLAGGTAQMPGDRPTPTGLDVPRWVSLKSEPVRARYGPGRSLEFSTGDGRGVVELNSVSGRLEVRSN